MNRSVLLAGALAGIVIASAPEMAQASTKIVSAKAATAKKTGTSATTVAVVPTTETSFVNVGGVFTVTERNQIVEFYQRNKSIVTNVKPLPPGIAKNLARGKPLPPGIAKKRLPRGLESKLPVRLEMIRYQIGPDVVAVDRSGKVLDILKGVFAS